MPVLDRNVIGNLPSQQSTLAPTVLRGMLGSETYRNYVGISIPRGGPFYQLTVCNLADPGRIVVKDRALSSLNNWFVHFQHDIFSDVVENSSWKFPLLQPSEEFYAVTFSDPRSRQFKVTVCPVISPQPPMNGHDVIRAFVCPPEFPPEHDAKLKSQTYAQDITNIEFCRRVIGGMRDDGGNVATGGVLSGVSELSGDFTAEERMRFRKAGISSEIVDIPAYYDMVFNSKHSGERSCGSKTIPQILGKLWFLRDTLTAGSRYKIVQLNQLSYVGVVENVGGFNVFFQCNCSMALKDVVRFLGGVSARVPWRVRSSAPYVARIAASEGDNALGTIAAEYDRYLNSLLESDAALWAANEGGDQESKERWQCVVAYQRGVLKGLQNAWSRAQEAERLKSLGIVANAYAKAWSLSGTETKTSAAYKARLASAAQEARLFALDVVLKDMTRGALRRFVRDVSDTSIARNVIAKVDGDLLISVISKHLRGGDLVADNVSDVITSLVPAVFASNFELAVFIAAMPAALPDEVKVDMFGSVEALNRAAQSSLSRIGENRREQARQAASGRLSGLTRDQVVDAIVVEVAFGDISGNASAWRSALESWVE